MRRFLLRALVLLLLWALVPGLPEVTENLWHALWAGHLAHARQAAADTAVHDGDQDGVHGEGPGNEEPGSHAPRGREHGCSGTMHLCGCHASLSPALASPPRPLRTRRPGGRVADSAVPTPLPPPIPTPERPPRV